MSEIYSKFHFFNFETNNVSSRILDGAKQFLEKENIFFDKATSDSDQIFLNYCKNNIENSEPLLCLRSRVSKSIANCVQKIFSDNSDDLKFDELALIVLNDDGRDYLRLSDKRFIARSSPKREKINWAFITKTNDESLRPFSLKVIKTCNLALANLATWSVQSVKGNKDIASYLRDNGVFLITKWALLADTSQSRIKLALERYGNSSKEDISYLLKLHNSYLEKYKPAKIEHKRLKGTQRGWFPDLNFLSSLDPAQSNFDNFDEIYEALIKLLKGTNFKSNFEENNYSEDMLDEENNEEDSKKSSLIFSVLKKSSSIIIQDFLKKERGKWDKDEDRKKAWQLYVEGMSQREIAKLCNHKQGWVSKLLQEKLISDLIADKTLNELLNVEGFQSLKTQPQQLLLVKERLRNQLVISEQQNSNSYLRDWIKEEIKNG